MQTNPSRSPQSHFDSIFNFIAPAGMEKPAPESKSGIVYDIFFEVTLDHIRVDMDFTNKDGEDDHQEIYLNHEKFRTWVEKENYLTISYGSNHQSGGDIIDDEDDYTIGYAEFCEEHLTSKIIADYLKEYNIVNHSFQLS